MREMWYLVMQEADSFRFRRKWCRRLKKRARMKEKEDKEKMKLRIRQRGRKRREREGGERRKHVGKGGDALISWQLQHSQH